MDGELHAAIARIIEKGVLADALIHGDRTVEDVAARFRELNAGSPAEYDRPDDDPSVSADEAAYRQVARFVKIRGRADSARVSAVLHALEAEMARRFPPVAAVHAL
jgi:hypothetical protein